MTSGGGSPATTDLLARRLDRDARAGVARAERVDRARRAVAAVVVGDPEPRAAGEDGGRVGVVGGGGALRHRRRVVCGAPHLPQYWQAREREGKPRNVGRQVRPECDQSINRSWHPEVMMTLCTLVA